MIQNSLIFHALVDSLTMLHQLCYRLVTNKDKHESKNV
jgi:hypothetical protein